MQEFGVGIVSGLVTATLVLGIRNFYIKVVLPWYEDRIYKDAKIEGKWKGEIQDTGYEVVTLKRTGHHIDGNIVIISGPNQSEVYEIKGEFRNLILTLDYWSTRDGSLDRGTYTLMLTENGRTLSGKAAYYEDDKHKMYSGDVKWDRS